MLDPTKIGYLRDTAPSNGRPLPATGPAKAMLNKLATSGHVTKLAEGYTRTELGDETIAKFDNGLSAGDLELLKMVAEGKKLNASTHPGINKLVRSRLLRINFSLENRLTDAGKAVIEKMAPN